MERQIRALRRDDDNRLTVARPLQPLGRFALKLPILHPHSCHVRHYSPTFVTVKTSPWRPAGSGTLNRSGEKWTRGLNGCWKVGREQNGNHLHLAAPLRHRLRDSI